MWSATAMAPFVSFSSFLLAASTAYSDAPMRGPHVGSCAPHANADPPCRGPWPSPLPPPASASRGQQAHPSPRFPGTRPPQSSPHSRLWGAGEDEMHEGVRGMGGVLGRLHFLSTLQETTRDPLW